MNVQPNGVLGTTDDPDHARHRRVLRQAFVPTVIDQLAPAIVAICDELLDEMLPLGSGDFVDLFAAPLPALAIAELLGVSRDDRDDFRHWSDHAVAALTGGDLEQYQQAKQALEDHVEAGIRDRDAALPGDGDRSTSRSSATRSPTTCSAGSPWPAATACCRCPRPATSATSCSSPATRPPPACSA